MTRLLIPVKKHNSFLDDSNLNLDELYVEQRFGRTPFYLLADLRTQEWDLIQNTNHHFGGKDTPVALAQQHKVDIILAAHIGYGPYVGFKNIKIPVIKVGSNDPISTILKNYEMNSYDEINPPQKGTCCSQ